MCDTRSNHVVYARGKYRIVNASSVHCAVVIHHLRDVDRLELITLEQHYGGNRSVQRIVSDAYAVSLMCFALLYEDCCLAIGGCAPVALQSMEHWVSPWLLGSVWLDKHPKGFMVITSFYQKVLAPQYPNCINAVWLTSGADSEKRKVWLERTGFFVQQPHDTLPCEQQNVVIADEFLPNPVSFFYSR